MQELMHDEREAIASDLGVSAGLLFSLCEKHLKGIRDGTTPSSHVEGIIELMLGAKSVSEISAYAAYQKGRNQNKPSLNLLYSLLIKWIDELRPLLDGGDIKLDDKQRAILLTFARDLKRTLLAIEKLRELRGSSEELQDLVGMCDELRRARESVVRSLFKSADKSELAKNVNYLRELNVAILSMLIQR